MYSSKSSSSSSSSNVSRAGRAVTALCISLAGLVALSVLLNFDETHRALQTSHSYLRWSNQGVGTSSSSSSSSSGSSDDADTTDEVVGIDALVLSGNEDSSNNSSSSLPESTTPMKASSTLPTTAIADVERNDSLSTTITPPANKNSMILSDLHGVMERFPKLFVHKDYFLATNENVTTVAAFRKDRFPSVQQRLQVYMSNWYLPPCDESVDAIRYTIVPASSKKDDDGNTTTWRSHNKNGSGNNDIGKNDGDYRSGTSLQLLILANNNNNNNDDDNKMANVTISSAINVAQVMYLEPAAVERCATHGTKAQRVWPYCQDVLPLVQQMSNNNSKNNDNDNSTNSSALLSQSSLSHVNAPVMALFGDRTATDKIGRYAIPTFRKARSAAKSMQHLTQVVVSTRTATSTATDNTGSSEQECFRTSERPKLETAHPEDDGYQPILWKLNNRRHFGMLTKTPDHDIPWKKKKNKSIWRGALTGKLHHASRLSPEEICQQLLRCRMVMEYSNSSLVDAALTTTADRVPNVVGGVQVTKPKASEVEMLEYKAIISLEGNDVSSGLKWNLLSNSVVLMPPPTFTSWAMEELLEPWIHYVPLHSNLSDVEEKTQWVMTHSDEAEKIAQRATLFIYDMFFHPDAQAEDEVIEKEIIRRYPHFFMEQQEVARRLPSPVFLTTKLERNSH